MADQQQGVYVDAMQVREENADADDWVAVRRRQYKACLHCRVRKQRCDLGPLDRPGPPPCKRCAREGKECVFAKQNRGGKKPRSRNAKGERATAIIGPLPIAKKPLQNPSQALDFLAGSAERDTTDSGHASAVNLQSQREGSRSRPVEATMGRDGFEGYELVLNGKLTPADIKFFVDRYMSRYHRFFPIVTIGPSLPDFCAKQPYLLTAMLTIAATEHPEGRVYRACWDYVKVLIMKIVLQSVASVDAVEALLLLGEWVPSRDTTSVGKGEEDRTSWMFIGLALRLAYFLGVDRAAFSVVRDQRKRLTWTYCYLLDRQVSVRVGKAFWSRGPGPGLALNRADFPLLKPKSATDENFAMLLQAQLDLAQLSTSCHDILYPSQERTYGLMKEGDYIKYLDDFEIAFDGWLNNWRDTDFSPTSKASLMMMFHYLRLYLRAFAFEATVWRMNQNAAMRPGDTYFPNGIASTGDARFIYGSIHDATKVLETVVNELNPEATFRYMPVRYYLYTIYASVFLLKVIASGATLENPLALDLLLDKVIDSLHCSAGDPAHVGARYSLLLKASKSKASRNRPIRPIHQATTPTTWSDEFDFSFLDAMPTALNWDITTGVLPFAGDWMDMSSNFPPNGFNV